MPVSAQEIVLSSHRIDNVVTVAARQRFSRLWQRSFARPQATLEQSGSAQRQIYDESLRAPSIDDTAANRLFDEIVTRYGESQRYYHTFPHIIHCLAQADLVADLMPNSTSVELAIWFHDVIYEPTAKDNEQQSVNWFRRKAHGKLPLNIINDVERLIMATVHTHMPDREDEAYMVDIDLSSFGLPWGKFKEDSLAVREESHHLGDAEYNASQRRFLKRLLDRPAIYSTEFFNQRYGSTARENIAQYLAEI